jgi:hypothetical protein
VRRPRFDDQGGYAILNFYGAEVWGWTYQLDLKDVRQILESYTIAARDGRRCAMTAHRPRHHRQWRPRRLHAGARQFARPLPEEVSFAGGAAISCGTGTAYGALARLDVSTRDPLAIFGLGPVGLSAAQLAAAMGMEVIGIDINPDRVERSKAFGVAHAIDGTKVDPVEEIRKLT